MRTVCFIEIVDVKLTVGQLCETGQKYRLIFINKREICLVYLISVDT